MKLFRIAESGEIPQKLDWIIFTLAALFCFLSFQHEDLYATALHSYKLIDITAQGNFFRFFSVASEGGTPFAAGTAYHIFLYLIFMIWLLPFYFLNRIMPGIPVLFLVLWCKVLLAAGFLASGWQMTRLVRILSNHGKIDGGSVFFAWLTCPLAFFAVFLFGQYDIFSVFFTLLAFEFFLKNKLWKFTFITLFAACFKNFAFLIFIPLILTKEKNPWKILTHCAIASAGMIFIPFFFREDAAGSAIQTNFQSGFLDHFFKNLLPTTPPSSLFIILYILICMAAFHLKREDELFQKKILFIPLAVFSVLFLFVTWHIQWFLVLAPWLILNLASAGKFRDERWPYLEVALFLSTTGIVVLNNAGAIDNYMLQLGALPYLGVPLPSTSTQAVWISDLLKWIPSSGILFASVFAASTAGLLWICRPRKTESEPKNPARNVLYWRWASVLVFIIPAILCSFLSKRAENTLFPKGFDGENIFLVWRNAEKDIPAEKQAFRIAAVAPRNKQTVSQSEGKKEMGEFFQERTVYIPIRHYLQAPACAMDLKVCTGNTKEQPKGTTFFSFYDAGGKLLFQKDLKNEKVTEKPQSLRLLFPFHAKPAWLKITSDAKKGTGITAIAIRSGQDQPRPDEQAWIPDVRFYLRNP